MMKNNSLVMRMIKLLFVFLLFFITTCNKDKPVEVDKKLSVLTMIPQGEEIPLSTEGITLMFDQAMVPLTTLDEGRSQKIPLDIIPSTPGKFSWLGTRGFIYRPDTPFSPATKYTVTIPAGVKSIEGHALDKEIKWEFSTVRPRVNRVFPGDGYEILPQHANFSIRFNLAMNRASVEKNIQILDRATNKDLRVKKNFIWFEDDHDVLVQIKSKLPFEKQIKLILPKEIRAKIGELGLQEDTVQENETMSQELTITSVTVSGYEDESLDPQIEEEAMADSAICYKFSQPIEKESFEKAFRAEKVTDKDKKELMKPFFYYRYYEDFPLPTKDNIYSTISGHALACASFLKGYNQPYQFSIDPQLITSLSGAKMKEEKGTVYAIRTYHAEPFIYSLLTKQVLAPEINMNVPYEMMNIKSATLRIYKIDEIEHYSERIKNFRASLVSKWDAKLKTNVVVEPPQSYELPGTNFRLPLDRETGTIDQKRMKADVVEPVMAGEKIDEKTIVKVDLSNLSQGQTLKPGLYLLEMIPETLLDEGWKPLASYSALQVTPIALAIKRELDHVLVWATDIVTGDPVPNLSVKVLLFDNRIETKSATGKTNDDGVLILKDDWSGVAKTGDGTYDINLCAMVEKTGSESLACEDDHKLTSYRSTLTPGPHYFSYIQTDRPLYRPGQTVYFSSFVREVKEGRYFMPRDNEVFDIEIKDAEYNPIYTKTDVKIENGGILRGEVALENSSDIPRGPYTITITAGSSKEQTFDKTFTVASYKKPSFKIDVATPNEEIISTQKMAVDVKGTYFFGAPLRKAKGKWSLMTSTYTFLPEGFESYSFVDDDLLYASDSFYGDTEYYSDYEYDYLSGGEYAEDSDQWDSNSSGDEGGSSKFFKDKDGHEIKVVSYKTDDKGLFSVEYHPNLQKYPTSQILSLEASVQDPSNQEVSGSTNIIVHKGEFYLGISPRKWVYGEKDVADIDIISLDTQGSPVTGKNFSAQILRREYKYSERMNAQGYWEFLYDYEDTLIKKIKGKTDSKGASQINFKIPQGGSYRIVLQTEDGLKNSIQSATTIYAWGKGYVPWRLNEMQGLELVPDKDEYKIGETAHVLVKTLMPVTKALVTLERGRVLEYKISELGGNAGHIDIPITEGMIPNLYLSIVAHVGKEGEKQNPMLFYGETELYVEPETKRLALKLVPDHKAVNSSDSEDEALPIYRPGEKVKMRVEAKDSNGNPVKTHVIVSAADESVLRMLNYKLPDLIHKFYYGRPNSVKTSSSMVSLKAGDGGGQGQTRKNFRDTAFFEANLATNDQGIAEFEFTLPDDLTTWVIDALGITESKTYSQFESERKEIETPESQRAVDSNLALSDNTLVGGERTRIMSTLPVLIREALPRFAAEGDEIQARVIANNRNPESINGSIKIELDGDAVFLDGKKVLDISFALEAKSEQSYPFSIKVPSSQGRIFLKATATDSKGNPVDAFEKSIPVYDRYAPEVVATSGMTVDKTLEQIDLPESITPEKGYLKTSFKASLGLAVASPMRELIYFPYGCSEQKSATIIASLMVYDLSNLYGEVYFDNLSPIGASWSKGKKTFEQKLELLKEQVQNLISDLSENYQRHDGGMGYWPSSDESSFYASAQTLWAYSLAQALGFEVDAASLSSLTMYIVKNLWDSQEGRSRQAYGLWALSMAGAWDEGVADELVKESAELSVSDLSYLLASFPKGNPNIEKIDGRLETLAKHESRHVQWPSSDFFWSSSRKNTALAAYSLLVGNPNDPLINKALTFLLNQKKTNAHPMTQDNLYVSWLGYNLAKIREEDKTDFKASLNVKDHKYFESAFDLKNLLEETTLTLPLKEVRQWSMPANLNIQKEGEGTLYYDLQFKYYLSPEQTPTREEGIIVSREYYSLDDIGEKNPLTKFRAGENYKGVITLIFPKELNYVLISDPLPAGFEPIDATLATSSNAARLMARENNDEDPDYYRPHNPYDDVFEVEDYGMDFGFSHQEVRDDSIIWSDKYVPPGTYRIRYPVRATTAGFYLMSGAYAFEFYEPEIFGRSRARNVRIEKGEE